MPVLRSHNTNKPSSDRLALLEAALASYASKVALNSARIDALEQRADAADRRAAAAESYVAPSGQVCGGCGKPSDVGMHGIFCCTEAN